MTLKVGEEIVADTITYEAAEEFVLNVINEVIGIELLFISDESMLSDILWGESEENTQYVKVLSELLGIEVDRKDYLVKLVERYQRKNT